MEYQSNKNAGIIAQKELSQLIKLICNESGDWSLLILDGKVCYEGHSIPNEVWLNLLRETTKKEISTEEISDEEMENYSC